jgi:hypothetical protein
MWISLVDSLTTDDDETNAEEIRHVSKGGALNRRDILENIDSTDPVRSMLVVWEYV